MRLGACGMSVLCIVSSADADLYAVSELVDHYYRLSTTDLSLAPLARVAEKELVDISLGPDGRYYAVSYHRLWRVDPVTGAQVELLNFFKQFSGGGLTVSDGGLAYLSAWWTIPGTDVLVWDVYTDELIDNIDFATHFVPTALHVRDDGVLLGTIGADVYDIDLVTGDFTMIGGFDPSVGTVLSFARDGATMYMLAGEYAGPTALYEADLFTFESSLVGHVQAGTPITGIAAIRCLADFNADGDLNILDFVAFQLAWQAGDDAADVNGDEVLDVLDFVAFQASFQKGCT
jgi:hypothetical protein